MLNFRKMLESVQSANSLKNLHTDNIFQLLS